MNLTSNKKPNRRLIVVLGMHRSGSSVITRGLQVLGVELGENLLAASHDNKKGYWEDADIHLLNIEMLKAIDSDWYHITTINHNDVETLRESGFVNRAVEMLKCKMKEATILGVKNPRMTKLLPFWQEVFKQCQYDVSYILSIRNPMSVAKSLFKRNDIHPTHSYHIWLGHIITSIIGSQNNRCVLIDYDLLMTSPDQELGRIASVLELNISLKELENYKAAFLNPKYQHSISNVSDLALDKDCPPIVYEVYSKLYKVALGELEMSDQQLKNNVVEWSYELDRITPIAKLLDEMLKKTSSSYNPYPLKPSILQNFRTISGVRVLIGAVQRRIVQWIKPT